MSDAASAVAAPWWKRWYVFVAFALAVMIGLVLVLGAPPSLRRFYIPSEAMTPTLLTDDQILAEMRSFDPGQNGEGALRRGDVILFNVGDAVYIMRLAALPGDRIEIVEGVVHLNGRPVRQRLLRTDSVQWFGRQLEARRLREQFPGETRPHEIYDTEFSMQDDMAELRVPAGHLFVLGDNRDNSADSRFSHEEMGVGLLSITDVIGKARSIVWRPGSGVVAIPLTDE